MSSPSLSGRLPSFVQLAKTIRSHHAGIEATLRLRLTNARIEAVNTTLRLIVRRAWRESARHRFARSETCWFSQINAC